jgi:DNA polymerase-3 subunit beta
MRIGDLARRSGLSASALRFYDRCDLLKPSQIDPTNGYRLYDQTQLGTAELIRELRETGMPLADVRRFLDASAGERAEVLLAHHATLAYRAKSSRNLLRGLPSTTQLEMNMHSMTVSADDLRTSLEHLLNITSTDPELPLLQSVFVEAADGSLRLVATDTRRLAIRDLAPVKGDGATFQALVSSAAISRAVGALDGQEGVVEVYLDDTRLALRSSPEVLMPVINGNFVNYKPYLESFGPPEHLLLTSLEAMGDALRPLTAGHGVRLAFATDSLSLTEQDDYGRKVGKATPIPASYSGSGFSLVANPRYLLDALDGSVGPDIALEASDPRSPLIIRSADTGARVDYLMPMGTE